MTRRRHGLAAVGAGEAQAIAMMRARRTGGKAAERAEAGDQYQPSRAETEPGRPVTDVVDRFFAPQSQTLQRRRFVVGRRR